MLDFFGSFLIFLFIAYIVIKSRTFMEDKLGIRYVSKWSVSQKNRVEESNNICKSLINHEERTSPEIVKLAKDNLIKKGNALTYPSVYNEILTIRKNNPNKYPEKSGWEVDPKTQKLTQLVTIKIKELGLNENDLQSFVKAMEILKIENPELFEPM